MLNIIYLCYMNEIQSKDISEMLNNSDPDLWYVIIAKVADIPSKLAEWRTYRGLTLRYVEEKTGLSNPLISQLETGKIKRPSFNSVAKLCELYKVRLIVGV